MSESKSAATSGPLAGIRVVDLSTVFAAPYVGGLLADLGADVIKVEAPARLDQTRGVGFGPYLHNDPGQDGWNVSGTFHSLNRGKSSLVLDLKQEAGRSVLRRLIDTADVLLENFTPRVMKSWEMTYAELAVTNPRLVMLSNTGYGAVGPWSQFKAQGTALESTMGLTNYSGYVGVPPKKVGQSYPDFLAAWSGLWAILASLYERERTERGRHIDLGMYQLGSVVIPEALIATQAGARPLERMGDGELDTLISDVYPAAGEDDWLAVALGDEQDVRTAAGLLGITADDGDLVVAVRDAIGAWAAQRPAAEAADKLQAVGLAASAVVGVRDLLEDQHLCDRGFFEWIEVRDHARPVIGRPYRWHARTRVKVRRRAPNFGEDNDRLLTELGLDHDRIAGLKTDAVVVDQPLVVPELRPIDLDSMIRAGTYRKVDPDFDDVIERVWANTHDPEATAGQPENHEMNRRL